MNKTQLIDAIAERSGVTKAIAKRSLDTFIEVASDTLRSGNKITISGFGSFEVAQKPARIGRTFLTGTPVDIPPKSGVKFRCSALEKEG